jgi:3-hydroxyacyl-CoA dehydrogenase
VEQVIRRGDGRFYRETETGLQFFDFAGPAYRSLGSPVPHSPASVARNAAAPGAAPPRDPRPLEGNAEASLRELGDRVAYVELHPKSNAIGSDAVRLLETALDRLDEDFDALVVRAKGRDFSASPQALRELFALAEERQWQAADEWVRRRQEIVRRIRGSAQPVVIAAAGRTLGWGAALCLAAPRVQAAAETSIGFTEIEAGLIPAGGGTVELIRRSQARIPADVAADLLPFVQWVFEPVARAKTSQSAFDARRLGYLADADGITMNPERLLHDAKMAALALLQGDYRPPLPAPVRVGGERVRAALREFLHIARTGGHITEFDEAVGRRLAHVMAGGGVPEGSVVGDDYLFDLEREAFLALLGEEKTRARLRHVEQTGRPFRN